MSQPPPPYDTGGHGQPHDQSPQQPEPQGPTQPYGQPSQPYPQSQPYPAQAYPQQPTYQGYPQGYAPAPSRPNNAMALVSLISGITGLTIFFFIGSIVALITGYMARKQIAQTGEEGGGMATGGIIMGWIGVAIGVLIGLGFLVLGFGLAAGGAAGY